MLREGDVPRGYQPDDFESAGEWVADLLERSKNHEMTDLAPEAPKGQLVQELLTHCSDYSTARRVGYQIVEDALLRGLGGRDEDLVRQAQRILSVLLYAAAVMGEDGRRVHRWMMRCDEKEITEVTKILAWKQEFPPTTHGWDSPNCVRERSAR